MQTALRTLYGKKGVDKLVESLVCLVIVAVAIMVIVLKVTR